MSHKKPREGARRRKELCAEDERMDLDMIQVGKLVGTCRGQVAGLDGELRQREDVCDAHGRVKSDWEKEERECSGETSSRR